MIELSYITTLLVWFVFYWIFAMGQNIMLGYGGLPMLGFMGLVAVGGYTTAILSTQYNLPFIATLPISAIMAMLVGFALGLLFMRGKLAGPYLVVGSIGFNYVVIAILSFAPYFGRMYGIMGVPPPEILGYSFSSSSAFVILGLSIALVLLYFNLRFSKSRLGLGLKAVREDSIAAESVGINSLRLKVLAFVLGALYAGVGGCLYVYFIRSAHPVYFDFEGSIEVFTMVILGGMGTIIGPFIGAMVPTLVPEVLRGRVPVEARFLVYSVVIILVILFEPSGLLGEESRLRRSLSKLLKPLSPTFERLKTFLKV